MGTNKVIKAPKEFQVSLQPSGFAVGRPRTAQQGSSMLTGSEGIPSSTKGFQFALVLCPVKVNPIYPPLFPLSGFDAIALQMGLSAFCFAQAVGIIAGFHQTTSK